MTDILQIHRERLKLERELAAGWCLRVSVIALLLGLAVGLLTPIV